MATDVAPVRRPTSAPAATGRRVTLTEAARLLGIDYRRAKRLVASGELPTVPALGGSRQVIPVAAVDALLARMEGA